MDADQLKQQVNDLLKNGKYDDIKPLLLSYKDTTEHDNDLAMVCYLCTICEREQAAGEQVLFSKISDMDELLDRYTALKFYLRRIDFDVLDEMEPFYRFLLQNQISSYELLRVIDFSVVNRDKVLRAINEGALSDRMPDADSVDTADEDNELGKDVSDTFCFIICTNNAVYSQE